ncbi:hypothetical protein [Candidatus Viadribacter manganicus]|uniref:Uncharacterized protein n=1 Tax=Candidatus Viadribacter manganicus TaxID=1759059 RepID=A0A1B1ANB6_9PROT|nr:hypothetical protein [Candidatus Viadribacter manganicus]ANP48072.1 hypothetical protein ATE48_13050 [Candidatus Viadribacter manganicus]
MSSIVSNSTHLRSERFEPEPVLDPSEQRKLRGHLEQIDYAAFAANRTVVAQALGRIDLTKFEHLAVAAAHARARWAAAAIAMTEKGANLTPDQVAQLGVLRKTFEELTEAYDAMRRMVERGYLAYNARA